MYKLRGDIRERKTEKSDRDRETHTQANREIRIGFLIYKDTTTVTN